MRGRKPIPSPLAKLHGLPRKQPTPKREPVATGDLCAAPAWMSADQKREWNYAIAHAPRDLLKMLDRSALSAWVVAVDLHRQAAVKLQQEPMTVTSSKGDQVPSPFVTILSKQALIMLKAAGELGFTPVSRPRIGIARDARAKDAPGGSLAAFIQSNPSARPLH